MIFLSVFVQFKHAQKLPCRHIANVYNYIRAINLVMDDTEAV